MCVTVHDVVNIGRGFCRNIPQKRIVSGGEKNLRGMFAERSSVLERVDNNASVNQCSHTFFNLSARASSKVISAGITPTSDFAISTRCWNGLVSLDITFPLRVMNTSSVAEINRYLLKFDLSSVAVIDIVYLRNHFVLLL